jgi:hypothetical protein
MFASKQLTSAYRFCCVFLFAGILNTNLNGSIPDPVSVADAFYAFDNNTLDLYSIRNGEVIGGPVTYVQGYVGYGEAIAITQSIPTKIQMKPGFNSSIVNGFTVEGFFLLQRTQLNAILVQLTATISVNLFYGVLGMPLGSNINITGNAVLPPNQWKHFSFVYDGGQQIARMYIDGSVDTTVTSVKPNNVNDNINSSIIVGDGFYGYIDQLSIKLTAKSPAVILWDATVGAFYPLDVVWTLDRGPNGLNATTSNVLSIYGWRYDALNFNLSGSNFQVSGLTALETAGTPFTLTLWIRAEAQAGIFLTIANPYTCLLVLGLQNTTNSLVAYLPDAISSSNDVVVLGPEMPSYAWVYVTFTWSLEKQAQLYTSASYQNGATDATTLINSRGGNSNSPVTVTLGHYNGTASCEGITRANLTTDFMGSTDEFYIFTRELQQNEIAELIAVYTT